MGINGGKWWWTGGGSVDWTVDCGWNIGWTVMGEEEVKGGREGSKVGGWVGGGNPVLLGLVPGAWADEWPRLAMVVGPASMEVVWRWRSKGGRLRG